MKRADVEEYLNLHALAATTKKRMDELKPALLACLREGQASPGNLPFLLERRVSNRTLADWKSIAFEYVRKHVGSASKAEQKIADIEAAFPVAPTESLHVVINRDYAV